MLVGGFKRGRTVRRIILASLAICGSLAVSGCHSAFPVGAPVPNATGYAYVNGTGTQRFVYSPTVLERALLEAMTDLGIHGVHRLNKADGVSLCGYLYDGRLIKVGIVPIEEETIVSIHIDVYGDEPYTKHLIDRTSARIAMLPPDVDPRLDPRSQSDSVTHRGQDITGYRGKPIR